MNKLEYRILEISYLCKSSHIGSCLNSVNIINQIYKNKQKEDIFVLSAGHMNLAWLVVLEEHFGFDAFELYKKHGVHPKNDLEHGILIPTGSLSQGMTCSIGLALENRKRCVHCLSSDGEWYSGAVFESLNFARENNLTNFKPYFSFNKYTAFSECNTQELEKITKLLFPQSEIFHTNSSINGELPFFEGLDGHYHILTDEDWSYIKSLPII